MKLTTVLYSLLIFISCANNTAKDKQNEKIATNSSEPKQLVQEKAKPTVVNKTKVTSDPTPADTKNGKKEDIPGMEKALEETMVPKPTTAAVEEKAVTELVLETKNEIADLQEEKQKSDENVNDAKETITKAPSHNAWDLLLQKYVDRAGNVDYSAFRNSKAELSAYLEALAKNEPQSDWSKNEKLAYYINLYNAATVKLILDNYPTKSIKDIKKPWGKDIVKVGNNLVSLGYIEHRVLRKMDEPRIHFAINCASYSCPKLVNKAFTAPAMEQQLEAATKDFVNDTTRNQFSAEEAKLSEIFKWYKGDFTNNGSLKEYINKYLATPMTANTKIKYLKYNWNLNEK